MTEAEWLASSRPMSMMGYLLDAVGRARYPDRLFRLFACACLRQVWDSLPNSHRQAVETAERYGWGQASLRERERAFYLAHRATEKEHAKEYMNLFFGKGSQTQMGLMMAARDTACTSGYTAARNVCQFLIESLEASPLRDVPELLREIFGNPFHVPALPGGWRAWNNGTVLGLARDIHEGRRYGEMPVLGDALEEAGCVDEQVLAHCRSARSHVPGCWVLELLLEEAA